MTSTVGRIKKATTDTPEFPSSDWTNWFDLMTYLGSGISVGSPEPGEQQRHDEVLDFLSNHPGAFHLKEPMVFQMVLLRENLRARDLVAGEVDLIFVSPSQRRLVCVEIKTRIDLDGRYARMARTQARKQLQKVQEFLEHHFHITCEKWIAQASSNPENLEGIQLRKVVSDPWDEEIITLPWKRNQMITRLIKSFA